MQNVFKWVLRLHCVQILFTRVFLDKFDDENEQSEENGSNSAYELFKFVLEAIKDNAETSEQKESYEAISKKIRAVDIKRMLKYDILPFLRCSYLFFSNLTDITVPDNLKEINRTEF